MAEGGAPGADRNRAAVSVPRSPARDSSAGHRLVAHAADVILEAWAPTRVGCLEEAVLALVESFVDPARAVATDEVSVSIDGLADEEVLVALLEEVLFLFDAQSAVPVRVQLGERAGGGVTGSLRTAAAGDVEVTGAVPKGVSRSGLVFEPQDGRWRCRVLVDV